MVFSDIAAHCAPQAEKGVSCQAPGALASGAGIPDSVSHCRAMEVRQAAWQVWRSEGSRAAIATSRACCMTQRDPNARISLDLCVEMFGLETMRATGQLQSSKDIHTLVKGNLSFATCGWSPPHQGPRQQLYWAQQDHGCQHHAKACPQPRPERNCRRPQTALESCSRPPAGSPAGHLQVPEFRPQCSSMQMHGLRQPPWLRKHAAASIIHAKVTARVKQDIEACSRPMRQAAGKLLVLNITSTYIVGILCYLED